MKNLLLSLLFLVLYSNLYSQNGWYQQYSSLYKINDIYFLNENTGWATGDSGLVVKTTNGGNNWINISTPPTHNLYSVHFINANTGCVAGGDRTFGGSSYYYSGSVYKTTNGGINWVVIGASGIYAMPLSVFMITSDSILYGAGGLSNTHTEGHLSRTTNGGTNFSQSFSQFNGFQFKSISFVNNSTGFAISHYRNHEGAGDDRIYRTTDFGTNWTQMYILTSGSSFEPALNEIQFINNLTGFAAGNGRVLFTSNGGFNWIDRGTGTNSYQTVNFINESTGWIGGYKSGDTSAILKTTNGGETWQRFSNLFSPDIINKIQFVNSLTGWACGDNIIMKTVTGGVIGIQSISNVIPDKFSLSQNYPNPFNPNTIINYQLTINSLVVLNVYDVNGRLVKNLVNEKQSAGSYEVNFDGSGLPSGTYIYRIQSGDFSETKKMLLLK